MDQIWPTLLPFSENNLPPPFPIRALPRVLREYVEALAESVQVPLDLPGCLVIAAASAAVAKRFIVNVKPEWTEPLNVYVAVAMPPASKKSQIFRFVMKPIVDLERDLRARLAPLIASRRDEIELHEELIKQAQRTLAKASPEDRELAINEIKH